VHPHPSGWVSAVLDAKADRVESARGLPALAAFDSNCRAMLNVQQGVPLSVLESWRAHERQ
jgi:hypothetical protein